MKMSRRNRVLTALHLTLVLALGLALCNCATTKYDVDLYQPEMIATRTTWAFTENPRRQPMDFLSLKTSRGKMIQNEVRKRINAKGYTETDPSEAELEVFYQTASNPVLDTRRTNYWEPLDVHAAMESPSTARQAGVAISVADPESQKIIWQGIATGVVKKGVLSDQGVREVLDRLFSELPQAQ